MKKHIPKEKGTYVLILKNSREITISAGTKTLHALPGYYTYCGSAFGSGGIYSRVSRHLKPFKKHRWHIDYIRRFMSITSVFALASDKNMEHIWAKTFKDNGGAVHSKGFGSSDCKCETHLHYFINEPSISILKLSPTFVGCTSELLTFGSDSASYRWHKPPYNK